MTTRCVSVVIAARHPVVLCGLLTLLHAEDDFTVVASCRDGAACIEAIRKLSPHLALLDVSPPVESGFQILAAIKAECLRTRVVFLSTSSDAFDALKSIGRNAYGVIPKDAAPRLMVQFLRQAASGLRLLPRSKSRNGYDNGARGTPDSPSTVLTERERQIMHLICEGLSNKALGRQLRLSEGTVKVHLHHIYQKLAIQNRTALAALATRVDPGFGNSVEGVTSVRGSGGTGDSAQ